MEISFQTIELTQRYPLHISRGEAPRKNSLFVSLKDRGFTGIGEAAPTTSILGLLIINSLYAEI